MLDMYIALGCFVVGMFGLLHQVTSGRMHPLATFSEMTGLQLIFTALIFTFILYVLANIFVYFPFSALN